MPRTDPFSNLLRPLLATAASLGAILGGCTPRAETFAAAPPRLCDTGLYADFAARTPAADVLPFTPQYPLWSDGAAKSRWIALPPGAAIDARDPDHWEFPIGTRLWKEFRFGRAGEEKRSFVDPASGVLAAVETRFMQRRADGSWLYATYQWNADGTDATLAPAAGVPAVCATSDGKSHDLPAVSDCRLCHEGTRTPVLGFSALQLSADRDPLAPHAEPKHPGDVDLPALLARGLVRGLPARWQATAPHIEARSPRERAALGYLHGNCSSCHNGSGPLQRLGLRLDYPLAASPLATGVAPGIATTLDVRSQFTRPGASVRVCPGEPQRSVLVQRLAATDALTQMPPFGRHLADREALHLVADWVANDLAAATDR